LRISDLLRSDAARFKFAIRIPQSEFPLDGRPAPVVASNEATWAFSVESSNSDFGDAVTGVAGHVSNSLYRKLPLSSDRFLTSTHLAPSFCEPGRVDNPTWEFRIADFGMRI
jgi:hypothetical protein